MFHISEAVKNICGNGFMKRGEFILRRTPVEVFKVLLDVFATLLRYVVYLSGIFRNNLTVIETIHVHGCGVEPKLQISNDSTSALSTHLVIRFTGNDAIYCRNRKSCELGVSRQLV